MANVETTARTTVQNGEKSSQRSAGLSVVSTTPGRTMPMRVAYPVTSRYHLVDQPRV